MGGNTGTGLPESSAAVVVSVALSHGIGAGAGGARQLVSHQVHVATVEEAFSATAGKELGYRDCYGQPEKTAKIEIGFLVGERPRWLRPDRPLRS